MTVAIYRAKDEKISGFSVSTYHPCLDDQIDLEDIQKNHVDTVLMYSLPRHSLSQDDCLNSASHPKLFTSRFLQQSWCIRSYKFQLGLINSLEVLTKPIFRSQVPATG